MKVIVRDPDRYGDLGKGKFPDLILLPNATYKEADEFAAFLSNYFAGCDYLWYVAGGGGGGDK